MQVTGRWQGMEFSCWGITQGEPWKVCYIGSTWFIINIQTGKMKKIGPVKMRGKNYFDAANDECKKRNALVSSTTQGEVE